MVDCENLPVGRVDDLELRSADDGGLEVAAILTGSQALGPRIGGPLGRWMTTASQRLRLRGSGEGPTRLDPALVGEVEPLIKLEASFAELAHLAPLERWLCRRLISRIPGGGRCD